MRGRNGILVLALVCGSVPMCLGDGGVTWFVDMTQTVSPDGTSWETAFPTLQAAITAADRGLDTILVRGGVFSAYGYVLSGNNSFIIDGLVIVGGMDGTSTDPNDESDPETYMTELVGDGVDTEHVVWVTDAADGYGADTTQLRGFTVRGGRADGSPPGGDRGGGIFITDASPIIQECRFLNNYAIVGGGAYIALEEGGGAIGPEFIECIFESNTAKTSGGGAMLASYNVDEVTTFDGCTFIGNRLNYTWTDYDCGTAVGAGMFIQGSPLVQNCDFIGNGPWNGVCNEIMINGGGVAINNYVFLDPEGEDNEYELFFTARFTGCVFRQNAHVSGGLDCELPNDPETEVPQTDFNNHGGGVYIQRSSFNFPAPFGRANPFEDYPTSFPHYDATFEYCKWYDNVAGNGGAVFMDRAAASFEFCDFSGNVADGRTAHAYDDEAVNSTCEDLRESPELYVQPTAAYGGGAISMYRLSYFETIDCKFVHNTASLWSGGAVYPYQGSTMIADRCYFVGNSAPSEFIFEVNERAGVGGAIWVNSECLNNDGDCAGSDIGNYHAESHVFNSLLVGNRAAGGGGAVFVEKAGWSWVINCTVMFNEAAQTGGILSDSEIDEGSPNEPCWNRVYNSIVWANSHDAVVDQRKEIHDIFDWNETLDEYSDDEVRVGYSCVDSLSGDLALTLYTDSSGTIGDDVGDNPIGSASYFPGRLATGTWTTELPVYDPVFGVTTFTNGSAAYDTNEFANKVLLADNVTEARSVIVSNTSTQIAVLGDLTGMVGEYSDFRVEHYLIDSSSPCHDEGDGSKLSSPYNVDDLIGGDRIDGSYIDMGCYEIQE